MKLFKLLTQLEQLIHERLEFMQQLALKQNQRFISIWQFLFKLLCLRGYCSTILHVNRCRATKQTAVNAEQCGKNKQPYIASYKKEWNKIQRKEKLTST